MISGRRKWLAWGFFFLLLAWNAAAFGMEKKWPGAEGYWLPEGASTYAGTIDRLFYWILGLTGVIFVITEALMVIFLIKYRHREGRKAVYTHGNHTLELVWTLAPALILFVIAVVQKSAWDQIKTDIPKDAGAVQIHTYAQQFQWNFRYAGNDKVFGPGPDGKCDDVIAGKLVVPVNTNIVMEQTSVDVIHSFFLPYMRLKQDVVPGMQIKVWFNPTKTTDAMRKTRPKFKGADGKEVEWNYEIVCAELCGMEHSQMKALMEVMEKADYDKWLAAKSKEAKENRDDFAFVPDKPELLFERWPVDAKGNRKFPPRPTHSDHADAKHGGEKH